MNEVGTKTFPLDARIGLIGWSQLYYGRSMTIYAWPANVVKSDTGWVTSLIDWPEIVAVGKDAQESVLSASEKLSNAVRDKIINKLKVPLPSEPKPGQIQIPIDADASARLEAHIEATQEKNLNRLSEIEQANLQKRASFLSEFRINMDPIERRLDHTDQAAIEYASIAIKSSFIMNGGALVAIPAVLRFTEKGAISRESLVASVILFVIGIALSAVTNILAYKSMFMAGEGHMKELDARTIEVSDAYYPPENTSLNQTKIKTYRNESQDKFSRARRLADFGVYIFCISILVFFIGIFIIIYNI